MPRRPALDVATQINATVTELTLGTNLFAGPVRKAEKNLSGVEIVPICAAFVIASDGPVPIRVMGRQKEVRSLLVDVRLRWNNFQMGDEIARKILNAIAALDIPEYMDIETTTPEPIVTGQDDLSNFTWRIGFILTYEFDFAGQIAASGAGFSSGFTAGFGAP